MEQLLYTVPEAAQVIGLSRATLYRLVSTGDLHLSRYGTAARIHRGDLEDLAERIRRGEVSPAPATKTTQPA